MRAASYLAFAVFSLGAAAMPTTAPNATNTARSLTEIPEAVRNIAADFSARLNARELASEAGFGRGLSVGESLPDTVELHSIPNHETYRYAVVDDHRFVVDAMSRKVVYVIR
ncbi:DUF1236 domain-containing protein [Microvirga zambiensis]|uniref:DUF1236 domain-containing protein n=1 Tax=Microvirga zambiensis TaxID=1402137 RepID=UPI00191ED636|nr:DUF1236 domain-containing protein [Microvirga zambiensis]